MVESMNLGFGPLQAPCRKNESAQLEVCSTTGNMRLPRVRRRIMRPRIAFAALLLLLSGVPTYPDEAKSDYQKGVQAESRKQYDAAYEAFGQAYSLKPREPKYGAAFLRARTAAAIDHVNRGQKLVDNHQLQEAAAEFQRAAEIDPTNFAATQELEHTLTLMKREAAAAAEAAKGIPPPPTKITEEAEGPAELDPSPNTPISLRMTTTSDNIYRTIGRLGGINVLFDLDYKPQKISVELNEVMLRDALRMVAMESKTFWRPISSKAIFVASEGKRKELESNVLRTFYVRNASNQSELQEVVGTLKGILDINRIQVNPTHNSITVRGTPDQLVLAEKLVSEMDRPRPEVVIDIAVMQVSRNRLHTIGTTVPTSQTVGPIPSSGALSGLIKLGSVSGNAIVTAIPQATFTFLMSDSNTKVLQKPELRALDNEKATLKIGNRVPVATGSFAAGIGGGGVSPLVNTQFQYLDVGVNIDVTPHIHADNEVTLKMVLEISTVTGSQNIGGIDQPVIGQRRIEHETRLQDGEVNLVGGILEDSETQSLSGYPWLANLPILKYLFGQEDKNRMEDEIVFAVTPHIVRGEEIMDDSQRLIDVGTGTNIGLRFKEPVPAKTGAKTPVNAPVTPAVRKPEPVPQPVTPVPTQPTNR